MPYIVGISSGLWSIARGQEAEGGIQYLGLSRKLSGFPITQGVNFAQLDLESISEFNEPDLENKMKNFSKKLGVSFGIHSEAKAFGEMELPYMDESILDRYRFSHERHYYILDQCIKIGSKYMLVHSSESYSFLLASRQLEPLQLVDFWGRPLVDFLEETEKMGIKTKEGFTLTQWAIRKRFVMEVIRGLPSLYRFIAESIRSRRRSLEREIPEDQRELEKNERELEELEKTLKPIFEKYEKREISEEEEKIYKEKIIRWEGLRLRVRELGIRLEENKRKLEIYRKLDAYSDLIEQGKEPGLEAESMEEYNKIKKLGEEELIERFKDALTSIDLAYGSERVAYYLIGKFMEITKDKLWENIIKINLKYIVEFEKKLRGKEGEKLTIEEWMKEKGIKEISLDDENFMKDYRLWVPAVSAKYIWGHFMQSKCPNPEGGPFKDKDLKKLLEKAHAKGERIIFALETPMSTPLIAEWSRLPNPLQMYYLIKEIDPEGKFMSIAIDLEHMLSSNIDPEIVVKLLPEDAGNYVKIIHSGYPSVLMPAHVHIPLGSEAMFYLYKIYFYLRQKGMGKKDDVYIIFERGAAQEVRQSITSLKIIVEFLEKDVKPEDILKNPENFKKFFGIDITQAGSIERQLTVIREHAWDPLKGLIVVPEEEHGFLGRAVAEKGKLEEWRKERYR